MKAFHNRYTIIAVILIFFLTFTGCGGSSGSDSGKNTEPENKAPSAVIEADEVVHIGTTMVLNGSQSKDEDGDDLTYTWEITSSPEGSRANLSDSSISAPELTPDAIGEYTISLQVNDGYEDSEVSSITITSTNTKPVADAGKSVTVTANASVTLDGSNSKDDDGDPLSYSWSFVSKPADSNSSLNNSNSASPSFNPDVSGRYVIQLIVNDGYQNSEPDNVEIEAGQHSTSKFPDTGQTECFDESGNQINCPSEGEEFYGQDANYTINPPSYTKLDSGGNQLSDSAENWAMVKDNVTGLIWEVKTGDGSIHDKDNKYTWQESQGVFIAELNAQNFGGYSDWRMPTVKELRSIVDYGRHNPAIDTNFYPVTMSSYYWSSTTYSGNTFKAWLMSFYNGYGNDSYYNHESQTYYVRAVRGGQ